MSPSRQVKRGPGPVQRRRSAETREKVVRAAIACVAEVGLSQTTAARIAERSGVSWGGIQHHFGDKAAILDAVLATVLETFRLRFGDTGAGRAPRERVALLVEATWDLMRDPTYQAFREIMRDQAGGGPENPGADAILAQITQTVEGVAQGLFADLAVPKARRDLMTSILFAMLSGMADQRRLRGFPPSLSRRQIAVLTDTLLRMLDRDLAGTVSRPRVAAG